MEALNVVINESSPRKGGKSVLLVKRLVEGPAPPTPYPSLPILRELKRLGVPITFSADAHEPAHLALSYRETAKELARAAGYRSVAVLAKGKWIEVGIDEA